MILAADIGGTTCKLGVMDEDLNILHKWEIPTNKDDKGRYILENIYESFIQNAKLKKYNMNDAVGVGLGVPGPVDFNNGVVNGAINLNWDGLQPVREMFETISGLPVVIDNDANAATLGEKYKGAGRNEPDIVCVTLGTGVGGGIISNDTLVHGHNGSAGELGHIKVDMKERFKCNCGNKGCLETVASATGVVNLTYYYDQELEMDTVLRSMIDQRALQAKMVFDAAKNGDAFALYIIRKVAAFIAHGLSIICVTTNPKYIIIGGGVSKAGDFLIEHIDRYFREMTFKPALVGTKIVTAELGNDAGIIGAAGLVKHYILGEDKYGNS